MMRSIGIVGCGRIAQIRHTPEYTDHRDARPDAFYGLNLGKTRELAGTRENRAYEIYRELLEDEKTDAIPICVPDKLHVKISTAALKAGKDVFCEKPVVVTLEECRQVAEAAEKTGQCSTIGQSQRLVKGHAPARKLTERGDTGKIIIFKTAFGHGGPEGWSIDPGNNTWFFDKKKAAMEAMADLGVHKTDLIQYLVGEYVAETTAVITTPDKKDRDGSLIGVDDNAICICKTESDVVGTMTASRTYYDQENNSTILYGSRGIMRIYEDPEYYIKIIKPDNEAISYNVDQIQTNDKQAESGVMDAPMDYTVYGKEAQFSGKSVLSTTEAVPAGIESAKTRETIEIG